MLDPVSARAWEINWNSNTWPGTAPIFTQTYSASDSATASGLSYYDPDYAGLGQIRVTISGINNGAASAMWANSSPVVSHVYEGGTNNNDSLRLQLNWTNSNQGISVKVEFLNYAVPFIDGVTNVQYDIFDVDKNGTTYIDEIRNIYGELNGGTQITPTITPSKDNQVNGTGVARTVDGTGGAGDGSSDGNARFDYGTNTIDTLFFDYGNAPGVNANPGSQGIGFGSLSFSHARRFPEVGTSLAALLTCAGSAGIQFLRRKMQS
jgi:hypothetical protein